MVLECSWTRWGFFHSYVGLPEGKWWSELPSAFGDVSWYFMGFSGIYPLGSCVANWNIIILKKHIFWERQIVNLFEDWLRPFYLATITCCFLNMFIIELNGQGLAMSGNQKLPGGKRNNRDAPNTPGSFGGQLGTYVSVKNHQVTFQKRPSFMAWRKLESYEIPSGRLTVCYWKWP